MNIKKNETNLGIVLFILWNDRCKPFTYFFSGPLSVQTKQWQQLEAPEPDPNASVRNDHFKVRWNRTVSLRCPVADVANVLWSPEGFGSCAFIFIKKKGQQQKSIYKKQEMVYWPCTTKNHRSCLFFRNETWPKVFETSKFRPACTGSRWMQRLRSAWRLLSSASSKNSRVEIRCAGLKDSRSALGRKWFQWSMTFLESNQKKQWLFDVTDPLKWFYHVMVPNKDKSWEAINHGIWIIVSEINQQ